MEKGYSLLWILFAIGVFVFRMVKKMQETTARESQERPPPPVSQSPGLPQASFQDLLRQMQARNAAQPEPANADARPQTPGGRQLPQEQTRPARSQERPTVRARSQEQPAAAPAYAAAAPRASAEAPIEDYWQQRSREKAEVFATQQPPLGHTVRQLLGRPESVRAAFVLSEILQRRHF